MAILTNHFSELAEHRRQKRNVRQAVLALMLVVGIGTLGFTLLETQWSAWDAFFFTLITITTVGYGDYGLDQRGEAFALILLLAGIGVTTYAFSQTVQLAVNTRAARRRKMLNQIAHLKDHFIICGIGRVGRAICDRFEEAGVPIVVIDPNPDRCEWARAHHHLALEGIATDDNILLAAGVERCRGLVAAAPCDNENLVITLTAREYNTDCLVICRAGDADSETKFKRAGANRVVAPETNGGNIIANLLIRPHTTDFLANTGEDDIQLTELHVHTNSKLIGLSLAKLAKREPEVVIVALKRHDAPPRLQPDPNTKLMAGDVLMLVGQLNILAKLTHQALAA